LAQVTLYLDEETVERVRRAARASGLSQSRWLAQLVREKTAREWPAVVRDMAGSWGEFPDAEAIRRPAGKDVRRETL
jgi:hypothetical protein